MGQATSVEGRKVAIVGSRDYPSEVQVRQFVRRLHPASVIVSGGAKGVDTWAESEARRLGMSTMIFPAKWHLLGKMAGYARNRDIVDAADEVVAFWDGRSRGTAHTAEIAERAGKPVRVYVDRLPPQVERVGL